jgi:hypothetical protein
MQRLLLFPFLKLYALVFPDAEQSKKGTLRFILFTLLIVGLLISGLVLAAVADWS